MVTKVSGAVFTPTMNRHRITYERMNCVNIYYYVTVRRYNDDRFIREPAKFAGFSVQCVVRNSNTQTYKKQRVSTNSCVIKLFMNEFSILTFWDFLRIFRLNTAQCTLLLYIHVRFIHEFSTWRERA